MNLKHPHDLVILMRQETTVNYLKELEVRVCNEMVLETFFVGTEKYEMLIS